MQISFASATMSSAWRGRYSCRRLTRLGRSSAEKKNLPGAPLVGRSPFRPGCSPIPLRVVSSLLEISWRTRVSSSSQLIWDKRDQSLRPVTGTSRVYPQLPGILQSEYRKIVEKLELRSPSRRSEELAY